MHIKKSRPALFIDMVALSSCKIHYPTSEEIHHSLSFQYIISLRECAGEEEAKTQNSPSRCECARRVDVIFPPQVKWRAPRLVLALSAIMFFFLLVCARGGTRQRRCRNARRPNISPLKG